MKGSLYCDSRRSFPLITMRASQELSVQLAMCCLWYLLPLKWVQERQLVFPHGSSLQTFSNGAAGPAERTSFRELRESEASLPSWQILLVFFIDKCYSTGNVAPMISHRGCGSRQDVMIYLGRDSFWLILYRMVHTSVLWPGVRGMSYNFISSGVTIGAVDLIHCPCTEIDLFPGHLSVENSVWIQCYQMGQRWCQWNVIHM